MRYRLHRIKFGTDKTLIHLLPSISIYVDDVMYVKKKIVINFSWLMFYGYIVWVEK